MMTEELKERLQQVEAGLKSFQLSTVNHVTHQLTKGKRKAVLVADEVGLGKTIVARGVIARLLRKHGIPPSRPFRVCYICSNQVIARENIQKLNLFPQLQRCVSEVGRVADLALYRSPGEGLPLEIISLTPQTSFDASRGTGIQNERMTLYALIRACGVDYGGRNFQLARILRGDVTKQEEWATRAETHFEANAPLFRRRLLQRFCRELRKVAPKIRTKEQAGVPRLYAALEETRERRFDVLLAKLVQKIDGRNERRYRKACLDVIGYLRRILTKVCVGYLNADLYILDEFQRFPQLLERDPAQKDLSEAGLVAATLFSQEQAKVLLLSATPYKAYTAAHEEAEGESQHYKEFERVLEFLVGNDSKTLSRFRRARWKLQQQLRNQKTGQLDLSSQNKEEIESLLQPVICRTERISMSPEFNAMVEDKWHSVDAEGIFSPGDVETFVACDRLVQAMNEQRGASKPPIASPIEYCKAAPYPLSFLKTYQLRTELDGEKHHEVVRRALLQSKPAWLDFKRMANYRLSPVEESRNGRFSALAKTVLAHNAEQLLWIPPSLPYYPLQGPFKKSQGYTKTLLFSAWVMVPRMIAGLLSYEVERRTIAKAVKSKHRKYFSSETEKEKRHPLPQLIFKGAGRERYSRMGGSLLLYPSPSLATITDPLEYLEQNDVRVLRREVGERIRVQLKRLFREFGSANGKGGERWYWAAPLLLDKLDPAVSGSVEAFLAHRNLYKNEEAEAGTLHALETLASAFNEPSSLDLGPLPKGLVEVLTDAALASPAVVTLRGLRRHFGVSHDELVNAAQVGQAFIDLFNKPESVAVIQLSNVRRKAAEFPFWRKALRYCADGCLQAVIDEYLHLLVEQSSNAEDPNNSVGLLKDALALQTATIVTDDLQSVVRGDSSKRLRVHFAVEMGNQRLETAQGRDRVISLRHNFNSPFRPFVLASTSIGQEGLDFHQYCRRIVHWNLPGNPVDLEQREGRVNRYKGHVIRQQIAESYGEEYSQAVLPGDEPWKRLFELAANREGADSPLSPYWLVQGKRRVERMLYIYPFSRDRAHFARLRKSLTAYRLAFGQPRQADLVDYLTETLTEEDLTLLREKLMIDLCPWSQNKFDKAKT